MGTLEIELPDQMETEIEEYVEEEGSYLSKSELMRDAVRHLLRSESTISTNESIHVNQQQIDRIDADSLEDVKTERE